ncbi:hypothetical protein OKW21_001691 [Catalinimonas alkaloidigena]|uniref:DUF6503 family protein n=1 Tax=Catalinimonas alkaloidigena TaxID=1075417 RepID=UPI002406BC2D|nr:DUF6503 family protein [Catalinimonas alkaloidigena]MDF9796428.1 hypothetical protein [Catalinimonas alkaloidigena]
MMQKLLDPGLNYEYLGEASFNEREYHTIKITFNQIGDKPTDIYQIYLNKETLLVDRFLFTVADKGVMDTPLLMEIKYEEIEGKLIPSHRRYKKSSWDANVIDAPWIEVKWSDIRFNNDLTIEDLEKSQ